MLRNHFNAYVRSHTCQCGSLKSPMAFRCDECKKWNIPAQVLFTEEEVHNILVGYNPFAAKKGRDS